MTFTTILATFLLGIVIGVALQTPYILRILAAAMLTKADTIDTARAYRRARWNHHRRQLGVARSEA